MSNVIDLAEYRRLSAETSLFLYLQRLRKARKDLTVHIKPPLYVITDHHDD